MLIYKFLSTSTVNSQVHSTILSRLDFYSRLLSELLASFFTLARVIFHKCKPETQLVGLQRQKLDW